VILWPVYCWLGGSGTGITKTVVREQITHRWYARPVLFVAYVNRTLRFHIDMLGFENRWHEGDGAGKVCQVNRAECEIILCEDATQRDKARLFVELTSMDSRRFAAKSSSARLRARSPGGVTT
jgi:hypothetical protein